MSHKMFAGLACLKFKAQRFVAPHLDLFNAHFHIELTARVIAVCAYMYLIILWN